MKFTLTREQLLTPLQRVFGAVDTPSHMPILSHVLLRGSAQGLQFTANNTEMQLQAVCAVDGVPTFACCIAARKLRDILKALAPTSTVDLSLTTERLTLTAQRARFHLSTLPADNFPAFETATDGDRYSIPVVNLRYALHRTASCMAVADVRYYLNGLCLRFSADELQAISSDGHRLAVQPTALEKNASEPREIILPRRSVLEVAKLLRAAADTDPVALTVSDNTVSLQLTDLTVSSILIQGKFPDVGRLVAQEFAAELILDRHPLTNAIRRAALLSGTHRGIAVNLGDRLLQLHGSNLETEESGDAIETDCPDTLSIGFNADYLLDALTAIDTDRVYWGLNENGGSLLRSPGESATGFYMIMPLKL